MSSPRAVQGALSAVAHSADNVVGGQVRLLPGQQPWNHFICLQLRLDCGGETICIKQRPRWAKIASCPASVNWLNCELGCPVTRTATFNFWLQLWSAQICSPRLLPTACKLLLKPHSLGSLCAGVLPACRTKPQSTSHYWSFRKTLSWRNGLLGVDLYLSIAHRSYGEK